MPQPFAVPAEGGRATWTDSLNLFKALGSDTRGRIGALGVLDAAGLVAATARPLQ
jgi:hypothetical protein